MTRRRSALFVVALWAVGVAGGLAARPAWPIDETRYLASDGDHPNSAGHQRIAAAVVTAIEGRPR